MIFTDDAHFRYFASSLESAIAKYGDIADFDEKQKAQVEGLIALEHEFRDTLIAHRWGRAVYETFVKFICDEKRNILAARPYFRERQEVFTADISEALKTRNAEGLYRFSINYQFIAFVMKARRWEADNIGSTIVSLARKIEALRTELIEMNMPLAISRARIFFSRTPLSHLTYMDLIQIASEGLMSGIDKYSPEDGVFSRAFRSTAIGRMTGNFIEEYSETLLHFYPADKRKLYRANKAVGRHAGVVDFERLATQVNDGAKKGCKTNPNEIADLMAAASTVSADSSPSDNFESESDSGAPRVLAERFAAPETDQPDVRFERDHDMTVLAKALSSLSLVEQKLLRLKGLGVENFRYMAPA
jgi:RNA polymerase sigma factor (sigma-70 family)